MRKQKKERLVRFVACSIAFLMVLSTGSIGMVSYGLEEEQVQSQTIEDENANSESTEPNSVQNPVATTVRRAQVAAAASVDDDDEDEEEEEYIVLTDAGGALTSGKYKLTQDLILKKNLTIAADETVVIDLNGYVLRGTGGGSVILNHGNLTVKDSNPTVEHRGTLSLNGAMGTPVYTPTGDFGFWTWDQGKNTGKKIITGGIITNGKVTGWNNTISTRGGGVANTGTFILEGGTIAGNQAASKGSAIASFGRSSRNANVIMTGGAVMYNVTTNAISEGVVSIDASSFTMTGGKIAGNRCGYGAGIFIEADQNIGTEAVIIGCGKLGCDGSCAVIEDNFAGYGGGGIYVSTVKANLQVICGTIKGNRVNPTTDTSTYKDGEACNDIRCNGAYITISGGNVGYICNRPFGNTNAAGNITVTGGTVNTIVNKDGQTIITGGHIGYVVAKAGTIDSNAGVTMSGGIVDSAYRMDGYVYEGSGIHIEGGNVTLTGGTISNCVSLNGGGVTVIDGSFDMSGDVLIKNCKAVVRDGEGGNGGGVYVSGGTVTIAGGTITSCKAVSGAGIYSSGGEIYVSGATIEKNEATSGAGIYATGGNIYMSGGTICNNAANEKGGGCYVFGGNLIMTGGMIGDSSSYTNGNVADKGGGACVENGNITVDGGSINYNTANTNGGGIYVIDDTDLTDVTINILSGNVCNNYSNGQGGGIGIDANELATTKVNIGLAACLGKDDTHSHPLVEENQSYAGAGGIELIATEDDDSQVELNIYCGNIKNNYSATSSGRRNINQEGGKINFWGGVKPVTHMRTTTEL